MANDRGKRSRTKRSFEKLSEFFIEEVAQVSLSKHNYSKWIRKQLDVVPPAAPVPQPPPPIAHISRFQQEFDVLEAQPRLLYKVRHKLDGCLYSIKEVRLTAQQARSPRSELLEARLHALLEHSNIVRYHGIWIEPLPTAEAPPGPANSSSSPGRTAPVAITTGPSPATAAASTPSLQHSSVSPNFGSLAASCLLPGPLRSPVPHHGPSPLVQHPPIGCTPGVGETGEPITHRLFLQMEFCPWSLDGLLAMPDPYPPFLAAPTQVTQMVSALLQALAYLHEQSVVHTAISSRTIFFTAEGTCKLGSFDHAVLIRTHHHHHRPAVSPLAPQPRVPTPPTTTSVAIPPCTCTNPVPALAGLPISPPFSGGIAGPSTSPPPVSLCTVCGGRIPGDASPVVMRIHPPDRHPSPSSSFVTATTMTTLLEAAAAATATAVAPSPSPEPQEPICGSTDGTGSEDTPSAAPTPSPEIGTREALLEQLRADMASREPDIPLTPSPTIPPASPATSTTAPTPPTASTPPAASPSPGPSRSLLTATLTHSSGSLPMPRTLSAANPFDAVLLGPGHKKPRLTHSNRHAARIPRLSFLTPNHACILFDGLVILLLFFRFAGAQRLPSPAGDIRALGRVVVQVLERLYPQCRHLWGEPDGPLPAGPPALADLGLGMSMEPDPPLLTVLRRIQGAGTFSDADDEAEADDAAVPSAKSLLPLLEPQSLFPIAPEGANFLPPSPSPQGASSLTAMLARSQTDALGSVGIPALDALRSGFTAFPCEFLCVESQLTGACDGAAGGLAVSMVHRSEHVLRPSSRIGLPVVNPEAHGQCAFLSLVPCHLANDETIFFSERATSGRPSLRPKQGILARRFWIDRSAGSRETPVPCVFSYQTCAGKKTPRI
ncbi:hypothetical protein PAPYR_7264 [Paratrimastix pyriformis]|uniref:non-specific serine/threonine protein kinase n=1 Tax=Paratrimastix pyriformis TaxID=342808 RepID=A0ABQ8UGQ9_9EUKA|nr:hypothetical protein PAPYR_7264 [Paratrimastix pyriformis]